MFDLTHNALLALFQVCVLKAASIHVLLFSVSELAFVGVDHCRSEDTFLSKIFKKTSFKTSDEIQVQLQAKASTAEVARPAQHPAPSNHGLVEKSGLQKWPLVGPTKREVVAEQSRSVHAVPVAPVVNDESYTVPAFELPVYLSLTCLFLVSLKRTHRHMNFLHHFTHAPFSSA